MEVGATPLHFLPQDREKRIIGCVEKGDLILLCVDADPIVRCAFHLDLTISGQDGIHLFTENGDFNDGCHAHNYRSIGKGVRADGGQGEDLRIRADDRSTC